MTSTWPAIGAAAALLAGFFSLELTTQVLRKEIPGVVNYTRVDASVGCAGATDTSAFPALKQEGFVSVVNLRADGEPGVDVAQSKAAAEQAGLRYFHVPFVASKPDPTVVERFLEIVSDKANQPVFVHCGSANRVGTVWLVKRVLLDNWTIERATEEAEAIGLRSPELKVFALDYIESKRGARPERP